MRHRVPAILAVAAVCVLALPAAAAADHATRPHTQNIHALGHSPQPGSFSVPGGQRTINSDLAFWGNFAFNGNYDGFRIIDTQLGPAGHGPQPRHSGH